MFFFQAEDGIRCKLVTGVQTCALPISDHYIVCGWGRMGQEIVEQLQNRGVPLVVVEMSPEKCRALAGRGTLHVQGDASDDHRSEERRAGKECRSPTPPQQQLTKKLQGI